MEDRITHLENLAQMSATLSRIMNEHLTMMAERQDQAEEWQRWMEEWQRRTEEWRRQTEEWRRRTEEGQRVRDELLQQLLQAVAVMQADIVRIDETHS